MSAAHDGDHGWRYAGPRAVQSSQRGTTMRTVFHRNTKRWYLKKLKAGKWVPIGVTYGYGGLMKAFKAGDTIAAKLAAGNRRRAA